MRIEFTVCLLFATGVLAATTKQINIDTGGISSTVIPQVEPGDQIRFTLPPDSSLRTRFVSETGRTGPEAEFPQGGILLGLDSESPSHDGVFTLTVPARTMALYYNVLQIQAGAAATETQSEQQRQSLTNQIASLTQQLHNLQLSISRLQDEIKAFTGSSAPAAVQSIEDRQRQIRNLNTGSDSIKDRMQPLQKQVDDLTDRIKAVRWPANDCHILRAGVIPIGVHRKAVYYYLAKSDNPAAPYRLFHLGDYPVMTTDDSAFAVIVNQLNGAEPRGWQLTFSLQSGSAIDPAPVRPVYTQPSVASQQVTLLALQTPPVQCNVDSLAGAYVDQVLPVGHRIPGESSASVSIAGYANSTTTDSTTTKSSDDGSEHDVITQLQNMKILDSDVWPQVHSKYHYNISTGVIWSTLRNPSFSRVPTGALLPDPSVKVPDDTTMLVPTYTTVSSPGSRQVSPALMFSLYLPARDTQVRWHWADLIPAPTAGLSLLSPTSEFFLGGSSEIRRNLELVYGVNLGYVNALGNNGVVSLTDSTAPATTTTLRIKPFIGLTFNIDFIRGLFGK